MNIEVSDYIHVLPCIGELKKAEDWQYKTFKLEQENRSGLTCANKTLDLDCSALKVQCKKDENFTRLCEKIPVKIDEKCADERGTDDKEKIPMKFFKQEEQEKQPLLSYDCKIMKEDIDKTLEKDPCETNCKIKAEEKWGVYIRCINSIIENPKEEKMINLGELGKEKKKKLFFNCKSS